MRTYRGLFFLGWKRNTDELMRLNGCILAACGLLKLVAASTAESELGGLLCNMQDETVLPLTLDEMGHP